MYNKFIPESLEFKFRRVHDAAMRENFKDSLEFFDLTDHMNSPACKTYHVKMMLKSCPEVFVYWRNEIQGVYVREYENIYLVDFGYGKTPAASRRILGVFGLEYDEGNQALNPRLSSNGQHLGKLHVNDATFFFRKSEEPAA